MGALTESMTRLRDEILVLRHNRQTFRTELERSTKAAQFRVSALRRAIASDLAGARRAWCGLVSSSGTVAGRAHDAALPPPLEHPRETRTVVPLSAAEKSHFKKHRKH
jgi:hypothetical protein